MVVPHRVTARLGVSGEDFDGLIEHVRSVEGTEVALLFRETAPGETKVSFRSNGAADVNRVARQFGGGGHVKAAGATFREPVEIGRGPRGGRRRQGAEGLTAWHADPRRTGSAEDEKGRIRVDRMRPFSFPAIRGGEVSRTRGADGPARSCRP